MDNLKGKCIRLELPVLALLEGFVKKCVCCLLVRNKAMWPSISDCCMDLICLLLHFNVSKTLKGLVTSLFSKLGAIN